MINLSENMVGGVCTGILLLIIAIAVGVMIISGLRVGKYEYLEKDVISLQYGVQGIVQKRKKDFEKTFTSCIAVGVMCFILGVVPLLVISGIMDGQDGFPVIACVGVLLFMIAIGVWFFVWAGTIHASFEKLLQQGDYTEEKKELNKEFDKKMGFIPAIYWCVTTAIYLGISLPTNNWDKTWVVWPVAGVLFAALMVGLRAFLAGKRKEA